VNEQALQGSIEFIDHPLIPEFLLIQDIGLTLTLAFMLFMYRSMLKDDDKSYREILSPWFLVALFGIGILTTYLSYSWGVEHFLFAFSLSSLIALTCFRPILGLGSFIALLLYRPWEMMNDPIVLAIPKYFGLLVIGIFLLKKFLKKEYFLIWNKESTFLLLFSIWTLFSVFKTSNFNESLNLYQTQYTRLLIIFFLMMNLIKTRLDFLVIQMTLSMTIVTKGIVAIVNTIYTNHVHEQAERLKGIGALADSNDFAAILIIGLPLLLSFFFKNKKSFTLYLVGCLVLLFSSYLIWMTKSRGAIIALLVLVASFFWFKIKVKWQKIAAIALIALLFFPITMTFKRSTSDLSESSSNRLNYWKTAVNMAVRNPLFGVGYQAYPQNFEKYAPEIFGEYGYRTAHSTWFLILGETGFLGLALFISFFVVILKKANNLREVYPELFYSFLGYSVTMSFLSHAYVIYPYILFALISVSHRIYQTQLQNKGDVS
jgi:putative inorganic carbon (HCO3(-)) transporter